MRISPIYVILTICSSCWYSMWNYTTLANHTARMMNIYDNTTIIFYIEMVAFEGFYFNF